MWDFTDIPGRNDDASGVWVVLDLINDLLNLIDVFTACRGPTAPLGPINRTEFAIGIGPFVPDAHAVFFEVSNVGFAF